MSSNQEELQAALRRVSGTTLDAQGAANAWAGTTGLDLLGALNAKAGTTGLGMDAVLTTLGGSGSSSSSGVDTVALRSAAGVFATPDNAVTHPINATYGDEFNEGTLNARWNGLVNVAAGDITYPHTAIKLNFDAQGDWITQTAPSGDFEIVASLIGPTNYASMTGVGILNSVGTGIMVNTYTSGNAFHLMNVTTYAFTSSAASAGTPNTAIPYWLALKKVGTTYSGRFSLDGTTFTSIGSTTSAITVAKMGVGRSFSNGDSANLHLFRFNYYPSPTYYA